MPHAALWVVQRRFLSRIAFRLDGFQCRTRLCGWCSLCRAESHAACTLCFNAARGFVGGAAFQTKTIKVAVSSFNAARGFVGGAAARGSQEGGTQCVFQCRTRLCGWCSPDGQRACTSAVSRFNAARGFVGGAAWERSRLVAQSVFVSMPHAALWVVQQKLSMQWQKLLLVSMPHAALWVVQRPRPACSPRRKSRFNAARGFVGGAANR